MRSEHVSFWSATRRFFSEGKCKENNTSSWFVNLQVHEAIAAVRKSGQVHATTVSLVVCHAAILISEYSFILFALLFFNLAALVHVWPRSLDHC